MKFKFSGISSYEEKATPNFMGKQIHSSIKSSTAWIKPFSMLLITMVLWSQTMASLHSMSVQSLQVEE